VCVCVCCVVSSNLLLCGPGWQSRQGLPYQLWYADNSRNNTRQLQAEPDIKMTFYPGENYQA
jgi:hypothetical protein